MGMYLDVYMHAYQNSIEQSDVFLDFLKEWKQVLSILQTRP